MDLIGLYNGLMYLYFFFLVYELLDEFGFLIENYQLVFCLLIKNFIFIFYLSKLLNLRF